jgi:hypothetical protein
MKRAHYLSSIDTIPQALDQAKNAPAADILVLGEYGAITPLALAAHLRAAVKTPLYIEIIARNKNRDLIRSYLLSAAAAGFDGILLATGRFNRAPGMAKPVYDMDPSQMLVMALSMRNEGLLPKGFVIAVRAPSGSEAALARARWLLDNGADLIAVEEPAQGASDRTIIIAPVAAA